MKNLSNINNIIFNRLKNSYKNKGRYVINPTIIPIKIPPISIIGENLEKIGYRESKNKPNLFYKQISDNEEKGVMIADLRGTYIILKK